MNNKPIGPLYLFHDYALINNGLEKIIRRTSLGDRIRKKSAHPIEELGADAMLFCGIDSLHQFTYQGELHPTLLEKRINIIMLIDACAKVDMNVLINIGVKGIVSTDVKPQQLIEIMELIQSGGVYISAELSAGKNKSGFELERENVFFKKLTDRELEVLKCITDEMTNKEIAKALFISPRTVETHRRNLIQKLKVKSSVGLVKAFLKTG